MSRKQALGQHPRDIMTEEISTYPKSLLTNNRIIRYNSPQKLEPCDYLYLSIYAFAIK